jgi:hypothetical protein
MDSTTAGGLGIFGIIMSAGGLLYSAINHKKFRCRCCGKELDASIDIDPTEPVVKKKVSEKVIPDEEMEEVPITPKKKHRRSSVTSEPES